jgi:preprotein translocase subunit SecE
VPTARSQTGGRDARASPDGDAMDVKATLDKVKEYFKEVYLETKRVTFPSRKETMKGTYVVLITVFVAAIFLGIVDVGLAKIIQVLLHG